MGLKGIARYLARSAITHEGDDGYHRRHEAKEHESRSEKHERDPAGDSGR